MARMIDLTNKKYGKLTVIKLTGEKGLMCYERIKKKELCRTFAKSRGSYAKYKFVVDR